MQHFYKLLLVKNDDFEAKVLLAANSFVPSLRPGSVPWSKKHVSGRHRKIVDPGLELYSETIYLSYILQ